MARIVLSTPFRDETIQKQFDENLKQFVSKESKQKIVESNMNDRQIHFDKDLLQFKVTKKYQYNVYWK